MAARALSCGYSEENQPEDKANTEEGGAKGIAEKENWGFYFQTLSLLLQSGLLHCAWSTLPGSPDSYGKRELLSQVYLHADPEKESAWTICMSVGPITTGAIWLVGRPWSNAQS